LRIAEEAIGPAERCDGSVRATLERDADAGGGVGVARFGSARTSRDDERCTGEKNEHVTSLHGHLRRPLSARRAVQRVRRPTSAAPTMSSVATISDGVRGRAVVAASRSVDASGVR